MTETTASGPTETEKAAIMNYGTDDSRTDDASTVRDGSTIRHRWESDQPNLAIVETVAAATGREPTDLPPLQGAVDTDALETVLTEGADEPAEPIWVSFSYSGVHVTVGTDGIIEVKFPETDSE